MTGRTPGVWPPTWRSWRRSAGSSACTRQRSGLREWPSVAARVVMTRSIGGSRIWPGRSGGNRAGYETPRRRRRRSSGTGYGSSGGAPTTSIDSCSFRPGRVSCACGHGHVDKVSACAVTPDGRRVVSASDDKTLKIWDVESGRAVATLEGHVALVSACAVSPDGRRVVSASDDKTLKVWDLESGRAMATLDGHADRVKACAMTPDGRRVPRPAVGPVIPRPACVSTTLRLPGVPDSAVARPPAALRWVNLSQPMMLSTTASRVLMIVVILGHGPITRTCEPACPAGRVTIC